MQIPGASSSIPLSPVLAGLMVTAALLAAVVCIVLAALYRRHGSAAAPLPAKHAPLRYLIHFLYYINVLVKSNLCSMYLF